MSRKASNNSNDKISDFGRRLKEAFKNSTNQSIAEKLGVTKSALTAYMQGRIPPADKLIEISRLTNCNLHWLLTGEGSRRISLEVERPQGIVVQGSKGGIGASTTALFIAAILALKGYGVLYADDYVQSGAKVFYPEEKTFKFLPETKDERNVDLAKLPPQENIYDLDSDYYAPTSNKNLDLFFPRTWVEKAPAKEKINFFRFDSDDIIKRYQFIVFDAQLSENPFYYGTNTYQLFKTAQTLKYFLLEPILRNAKVVVPFDVIQSQTDNVRYTIEHVKEQKRIYPNAGFAGVFLNEQSYFRKPLKEMYERNINKLEEMFGSAVLKSRISYHKELSNYPFGIKKILFSRKTNMHKEFSALVDEILQKLGY